MGVELGEFCGVLKKHSNELQNILHLDNMVERNTAYAVWREQHTDILIRLDSMHAYTSETPAPYVKTQPPSVR